MTSKNKPLAMYFIRLFWSKEDSCFVAEAPELKGCSALGETEEVAVREVRKAMALWIATARKVHKAIPEPMQNQQVHRLNLRLPADIIHNLKIGAKEMGLSLNQYLLRRLSSLPQ